jgi:predicted nucleic acid-binding protein
MLEHRSEVIRTSVISAGELAPAFARSENVWQALKRWTIYRLHDGIVNAAADLDREMIRAGTRLGENGNWIAGFCLYYRQPLITRDGDFKRVPRLRCLAY